MFTTLNIFSYILFTVTPVSGETTPSGTPTLREMFEAKKAASKPVTQNPDNKVKSSFKMLLDEFVGQQS